MKALSILGSSSNAGKSWVATAVCAWLKREGVRVAPFKAQNMSNNAYATLDGGEIGVAQAVQAEACGLTPSVEMNPILLKPNGEDGSQIVRLGKAGETVGARDYYRNAEVMWELVRETLDFWKSRCDVLVIEGAGSPVELNLMDRDVVNLKPIEYLDGRWLLVSNIEYGGVFAQVLGTWGLLPDAMKARGLGAVVNRFRGDVGLFDTAGDLFRKRMDLPYLGVLPFDEELRIDDEDSLNASRKSRGSGVPRIAWVRYPRLSNSQDMSPWIDDAGIDVYWAESVEALAEADAIVLPGSKNTLEDLRWLKAKGLASAVEEAAKRGKAVVGICGGYQMLGNRITDTENGQIEDGLGLLPLETDLLPEKRVVRNVSRFDGESWETFEIHQGVSRIAGCGEGYDTVCEVLGVGESNDRFQSEGIVRGKVWGSYQHGLFDGVRMRRRLVDTMGATGVVFSKEGWRERRRAVYAGMADLIEQRLDLSGMRRYFGI